MSGEGKDIISNNVGTDWVGVEESFQPICPVVKGRGWYGWREDGIFAERRDIVEVSRIMAGEGLVAVIGIVIAVTVRAGSTSRGGD
jgi:hypothetical protein